MTPGIGHVIRNVQDCARCTSVPILKELIIRRATDYCAGKGNTSVIASAVEVYEPLTRRIPAACSGLNNPESAASLRQPTNSSESEIDRSVPKDAASLSYLWGNRDNGFNVLREMRGG